MTRGEAVVIIKAKVRKFCDASLEPSAAEARALIWEVNNLVDDVATVNTVPLDALRREAFDQLLVLGILVRCCARCRKPCVECICRRKGDTFIMLNRSLINELEIA